MPTYTLKDVNTLDTFDVFCSYSDLQIKLEEMPDLVQVIGASSIIHETGTNIKVDDGFREAMSRIKENHRINNIKDY
jgi:hypothetical protein|tara:strand:+ start:1040 stop:1270 length:231 start_codon:yes stop_codon:yes gene_type:complete